MAHRGRLPRDWIGWVAEHWQRTRRFDRTVTDQSSQLANTTRRLAEAEDLLEFDGVVFGDGQTIHTTPERARELREENGQWQWTWVFRAPQFTLFHIDPKRGTNVLKRVLGSEFSGTLMADYYSAYRCYLASQPRADAQFCLAHLIRDVKFLNESANQADRQFATALLVELKELFRLWNTASTDGDEATFRAALIAQGERLESLAMEQAPNTKASRRVRKRFAKHAKEYLRFTHVPGIEPTNNAAERAIRQIVIDRKVTQGTRSPRGRAWCERIWTTIATCRQHGRDLLSFLQQSLLALLTDTPPPSLLAPHN